MPRNSSGQYNYPPGTPGQPNRPIESAKFNGFVDDLTADMNTPRPITAGGTGAVSAAAAMEALGGVSIEYLDDLFCGLVSFFPMNTPPDGWLVCDGTAVSRTTYSKLFERIDVLYGVGNGTTTFNVPDLRGEFIRGADAGRGVDPSRVLGSAQADDVKPHTHTGTASLAGAHTHPYNTLAIVGGAQFQSGSGFASALAGDTTTSAGNHTHTVTVGASGGVESRPRNIAMLACIKW